MANLIAAGDYKDLADYYSTARDRELGVNDDLFDAVYKVVFLDDLMPEVDLLNVFWNSYLLSANQFETPSSLLGAVRALNAHVIVRGGYADINDYFAANAGTFTNALSPTWQDMSADVGYDITDTYVI